MIDHTGFIHCPRCGRSALEVHQKNAMRCTACEYVYFHNVAAAVAGIIEIEGGILLTTRGHEPCIGGYDLPGGFMDYGETAEYALRREIREELGLDVAPAGYLCSYPNRYVHGGVDYFTCDLFFMCHSESSPSAIAPNIEIATWEIVPVDRIPFGRFAFASHANACRLYSKRNR